MENYKELRQQLESKLTGDFMKDMDIREQIHALDMKNKGVSPQDGSCDIGCDSCGA